MNPCDPLVLTMNSIAERSADGAERKLGCVVEPPPWAAYDAWLKRKKMDELDAKCEQKPNYMKHLRQMKEWRKKNREKMKNDPEHRTKVKDQQRQYMAKFQKKRDAMMEAEREKKLASVGTK